MADNLLSPKSKAPNGIPPKNIIAFIALGAFVAIGLGAMFMDSSKSTKTEEAKKTTLQEATAVKEPGTQGDAKDVTLLADKAGLPASLRGVSADDSVSSPKSAASASQGPTKQPLPTPFPTLSIDPAANGSKSTVEATARSAEALRETEIAAKSPLVFDESGASSKNAKSLIDPVQSLIDQERIAQAGRSSASSKLPDLANLAGLIAGQNQSGQQPASGKDADKAFLSEYSSTRKDPGIRPLKAEASLVLTQGSVIEAVLLRELNSDLPGVVTARTTRDIYDTTTMRTMVLPKGTLAMGEYSSQVRQGQERMLFAFTRLVLPNGQSFDLPGFNGSDAAGRAGLDADVDNHYIRLFGASLLIGLLADRVIEQKAVPQGSNGQSGGLSATGQILVDTTKTILERNREVKPTLRIPSGARLVIEVKRDMVFPSAYRG